MNTSLVRAPVSIVTIAIALMLGACSRAASLDTPSGALGTPDGRVIIDFVNEGQAPVDVYLISEYREWRLGRVAPGVHTRLPIPARELSTTSGFVQLAALAD